MSKRSQKLQNRRLVLPCQLPKTAYCLVRLSTMPQDGIGRVTDAPSCINLVRRRTPHSGAVRTLFRVCSKFSGVHTLGIWRIARP
jgi:hypothetical protein